MTSKTKIPFGAYWSTPFARWQGSLADLNSVELAAQVARRGCGLFEGCAAGDTAMAAVLRIGDR